MMWLWPLIAYWVAAVVELAWGLVTVAICFATWLAFTSERNEGES